jgi:hypothetical protein
MFCSVIEIDLKKDKDRFIAVTRQMEQEGGVVILSSGSLMDVEEIVCEKKGNTLTFSTVKH